MIDCEPCSTTEPIIIAPNAESIQCARCGVWYPSRGKTDPGICRACERDVNALNIGGPLGERRYSGLVDDD